ncbi:hypothetical protein QWY84_14765 [Aquisalimonas lutea]|uniref:hypothetical protein n=1 Tax=Aquisalimonas lutea TaxID=1327750 RepID=UPI0025B5FAEA|nr:hypothetical protein [Aquisalimonas lutea]MDN3518879.1 hypothetical protein [Aquisalimonas lutea]
MDRPQRHRAPRRSGPWYRIVIAAVLLALVLPGASSARADDGRLSRNEAVELIRERTDGRVLGVDARNGARFIVRVLVREGEVRVYEVDRRTREVR